MSASCWHIYYMGSVEFCFVTVHSASKAQNARCARLSTYACDSRLHRQQQKNKTPAHPRTNATIIASSAHIWISPPPAWKQVFSQFGSGSQVGASWAIASRHAFRYAGIRPYKYTGIQVYWRTRIKGLTAIQVYGHAATHLHAAIVLSRSLAL